MIFREGSSFLGTSVQWSSDAWVWNVINARADDAPHIRKLIGVAGSEKAALERIVWTENPRVKQFAKEWGLVT